MTHNIIEPLMLSIVRLSVIMTRVIMLSVVAPKYLNDSSLHSLGKFCKEIYKCG